MYSFILKGQKAFSHSSKERSKAQTHYWPLKNALKHCFFCTAFILPPLQTNQFKHREGDKSSVRRKLNVVKKYQECILISLLARELFCFESKQSLAKALVIYETLKYTVTHMASNTPSSCNTCDIQQTDQLWNLRDGSCILPPTYLETNQDSSMGLLYRNV